jgi:MinD-like ATPase involved in chromosome partitioning or flagellar assembly
MKTQNAEKDRSIYGFPPTLPGIQDTPCTYPAHAVVVSDPTRHARATPGFYEAPRPTTELIRPAAETSGKTGKGPEKAGFSEPLSSPLLLTRHMALNSTPAPYSVPEPPASRNDPAPPHQDPERQHESVTPLAGLAVPPQLPVKVKEKRGHLILVARSRGGMGATSVAVNLALELAKPQGWFRSRPTRRVALVDLDVQFGTAGSILDIEDRGGMLALARMTEEPDRQAVRTALISHKSGLDVLPAPKRAIPLDALDSTRVASIMDPLLSECDFVIVDLPHALVRWLEPLLRQADRLLMVTDLAVPSVVTARRLIDLLREDNAELGVEIVVTREEKPIYARKLHRDASSALGLPLRHWLPEEVKLSRKAFDRGEALVELSPGCRWSRALRKLAQHIDTAPAANEG